MLDYRLELVSNTAVTATVKVSYNGESVILTFSTPAYTTDADLHDTAFLDAYLKNDIAWFMSFPEEAAFIDSVGGSLEDPAEWYYECRENYSILRKFFTEDELEQFMDGFDGI